MTPLTAAPGSLAGLRVALVHDYLVDSGGAERVVLAFHELFPDAPLFTSVYDPASTFSRFRTLDVRTSWLQRIGATKRSYKYLLPLFPLAFESFDLAGFDVVLSSTTSFAKGIITSPATVHVCFCHTPTRFAWRSHDYVRQERIPRLARPAMTPILHGLRMWDSAAAQRVDHFVVPSRNSAARVRKYYRRAATVIPSPIDASTFAPEETIDDYFLVVSRLAPYKRIDLAIEACNALRRDLVIVGDGPARPALEAIAGPTVRFLGRLSERELRRRLARCIALILPGEEDFGLTPLEANASGRPVVAYAAGGALETVIEGRTGTFFHEWSAAALAERLRTTSFDRFARVDLLAHARAFDKEPFKERIGSLIAQRVAERGAAPAASLWRDGGAGDTL